MASNELPNLYNDALDQIILQSDSDVIVELARTNRAFRQRLENPYVLEQIGRKFGWHLETIDDFFDAYYTSEFTPESYRYLDLESSLKWAIRSGHLDIADQLFEHYRFHSLQADIISLDVISWFMASVFRSQDPIRSHEWVEKKLIPYYHRFDLMSTDYADYQHLFSRADLKTIKKISNIKFEVGEV